MNKRELFLTFFYTGKVKKAPGTFASFIAIFPALAVLQFLPQSSLFLLAILIGAAAYKQIDIYEKEKGVKDPKEIVIDELIGMWIALSLASGSIMEIVFSFIFFRIFDITKPSIIKRAENIKGGAGVILDDVLAGVFGGICSATLAYIIKSFT